MSTRSSSPQKNAGLPAHTIALLQSDSHHHEARPSLLTNFFSSGTPEPEDALKETEAPSYRGLINLGVILLFILNVRLMVSNIRKYGIIADFSIIYNEGFNLADWPNLCIILSFSAFIFAAYAIEKAVLAHIQKQLKKVAAAASAPASAPGSTTGFETPIITLLQIVNVFVLVTVPSFIIFTFQQNPLSNIFTLLLITCVFCKLWSYGDVNSRLRVQYIEKNLQGIAKRKAESSEVEPSLWKTASPTDYPNNISLYDISYFMLAPTLCYQTDFPKTPKIRWTFVIKRVFELLVICFVEYFIAMQYMLPLLQNTIEPFAKNDFVFVAERLLKLAVPNMFVWLIGFYGLFHIWLNILAELTCFADRRFYEDWWNCTDVGAFWRKWNLPVKNFFFQHVHKPLLERGSSRTVALAVIFFFSAVFHELIVSVGFSTIQFWAFGGMIAQVFAVLASQPMKGKQIGNIFFWLTIMLGQPLIVLFYFVDYASRHQAVPAKIL